MTPLWKAAVGSIVRAGFYVASGYLIRAGVWAPDAAALYVDAATCAAVGFLWSLYQKWDTQRCIAYLEQRLHWHQRL